MACGVTAAANFSGASAAPVHAPKYFSIVARISLAGKSPVTPKIAFPGT